MLLQALHCCTEVNFFKDMKTLNSAQNSSEDVHLLSVLSLFLLFKNWIHAFPIKKKTISHWIFLQMKGSKSMNSSFFDNIYSFVTIKNRLQNAMWASLFSLTLTSNRKSNPLIVKCIPEHNTESNSESQIWKVDPGNLLMFKVSFFVTWFLSIFPLFPKAKENEHSRKNLVLNSGFSSFWKNWFQCKIETLETWISVFCNPKKL